MQTLILILAALFASLFIAIPLIEKYSTEKTPEELNRMSRYMVPLFVLLLIASAARYFFF
jgi:hypothetical protein